MKEKNSLAITDYNLGKLKKELSNRFKQANIKSHYIDADLIISKVTGLSREKILAYPELKLSEKQLNGIFELSVKRVKRYPMAYILGYKDFYGLNFKVNENVLIPRPETEHLIETFLKYSHEFENILDLCCGSGCIGITVKHLVPNIEVTLSDISKPALDTARENAVNLLKSDKKITFIQSSLFENIKGKFDAILCNPPYVSEREYIELSTDVHFEPEIALLGKNNGLEFYERIALEAKEYLKPGGFVFFEMGDKQIDSIIEICQSNNYIFREQVKDYSGKDRIVVFSI